MLVLSRRIGERVRVSVNGVEVWVTVLSRRRPSGVVSLGFEAPPEARIDRAEVVARQRLGMSRSSSTGSTARS